VHTHDAVFMKKFSMLIGLLAAITIVLAFFGHWLMVRNTAPHDAANAARAKANLQPIGAVYAGATGAAAQAAAAQAAAAAASAGGGAYGGTTDGKTIFDNLCTGCHTSGAGGAPTLTKAHWDARIAQGTATLYKHAIDGYHGPDGNFMPAKGGNPALTDKQVEATVDWMLTQIK
jgi:cytochrome c5